ncbi:MAG: ABC transporter ATP-binding protein [Halobacteriaceae archaeon]
MLRTRNLTKTFGGLTAVDHVNFELQDELCSVIGPNGAGKTTFFNLLTGSMLPTEGEVELHVDSEWQDITGADPHETAQMGLSRSYQITNIFPTLTVLENVRIAAQAKGSDSRVIWRNVGTYGKYYDEAMEILDRIGLADSATNAAQHLSHGEKRQLEVGIAMTGNPDVLLLDEPSAGISSESVHGIISLIEDIADDHAVLIVEHDMDIVMEVSDRIVVLHQGEIIADDEPNAVRNNDKVQQAYLGGYERDNGTNAGEPA